MQKIAIDNGERRVLVHERKQVRAHIDQRRGAAGRAIEPPDELVTAGFRRKMDFARRGFVAVRAKVAYGFAEALAIRPELVGKRMEERGVVHGVERAVAAQDLGGESDA